MIICIIQARIGSTRLPGKILKPILGKSMLMHQIERVKRAPLIDKIVITTTTKKEDDLLDLVAKEAGVGCFRGSDKRDVLDDYYQIAKVANADVVVRVTGDCPLSDPQVINETIEYFLKNAAETDYTSKPANYPEGLDVEVFSFDALSRAWKEATKPSEHEHVTPYIYNHPEIFRLQKRKGGKENFSAMHWSVDTPEDFIFVTKIFENFYLENHFFSKDDVIKFLLKNPELLSINSGGTGYEGYAKSLKEDEQFQQKRNIYEEIVGLVPDAIILVSGGVVKETGHDRIARYRSAKADEGDAFGILWGEARTLAAVELAIYFPKAVIITISALCGELGKFLISKDRVIVEENSANTLSEISEAVKIIYKNRMKQVVFITNEYHIPRVCAMYENFEKLLQPSSETKSIIEEIKRLNFQVQFVAAESILPHRDKKFIEIIRDVKKGPAYLRRVQNEKIGTAMVKSGEYGRRETAREDKLERGI